jgi:hypothetical protein
MLGRVSVIVDFARATEAPARATTVGITRTAIRRLAKLLVTGVGTDSGAPHDNSCKILGKVKQHGTIDLFKRKTYVQYTIGNVTFSAADNSAEINELLDLVDYHQRLMHPSTGSKSYRDAIGMVLQHGPLEVIINNTLDWSARSVFRSNRTEIEINPGHPINENISRRAAARWSLECEAQVASDRDKLDLLQHPENAAGMTRYEFQRKREFMDFEAHERARESDREMIRNGQEASGSSHADFQWRDFEECWQRMVEIEHAEKQGQVWDRIVGQIQHSSGNVISQPIATGGVASAAESRESSLSGPQTYVDHWGTTWEPHMDGNWYPAQQSQALPSTLAGEAQQRQSGQRRGYSGHSSKRKTSGHRRSRGR